MVADEQTQETRNVLEESARIRYEALAVFYFERGCHLER